VLASPWITALGRNLYWSLWLFLVPALAVGAALAVPGRHPNRRLAAVAFFTLLVRSLAGYEDPTESVAIALAPVLYSPLRDAWPLRVLWRRFALLGGAVLAAVALSLACLTLQITLVTGSALDAAQHIRLAVARRASGDPAAFPPIYEYALRARA